MDGCMDVWVDGGKEGRKELEVSSATRRFGLHPIRRISTSSTSLKVSLALIKTFRRNRKKMDNFRIEATSFQIRSPSRNLALRYTNKSGVI